MSGKVNLLKDSRGDLTTMTTKVPYDVTQSSALLKRLLQLYVEHSGTSEDGFSLADVGTTLSLSRAQTEAVVETLVSEGYLSNRRPYDSV